MSVQAVIIDANAFSERILSEEIISAIEKGVLQIVLSLDGKLKTELLNANTRRYIEYSRGGNFYGVCEKSVKRKTVHLKTLGVLKSNDHHVIALAIVSGANILVSDDRNLGEDFKQWKDIDHNSKCISHLNPPSRGNTKVVVSTHPTKTVRRIIKTARVNSTYCECHIREGGC